MALLIVDPGFASTVQDAGRRGCAALGVPRAGPVDPQAHAHANRLVGNPESAAAFETAGGLRIQAATATVVATSADGYRHTLQPGDRFVVPVPVDGQWGYLAVRGGIEVPSVLGSCSHDTLSGLGPPALAAGQQIAVGPDPGTGMPADVAPRPRRDGPVRLWPGPLDPVGRLARILIQRIWIVKNDANRVGVRLTPGDGRGTDIVDGEPLVTAGASSGLVTGAVQFTPIGEPIVMLANHPTTGGYGVIAVVEPDDITLIAQARPGSELRFRSV